MKIIHTAIVLSVLFYLLYDLTIESYPLSAAIAVPLIIILAYMAGRRDPIQMEMSNR